MTVTCLYVYFLSCQIFISYIVFGFLEYRPQLMERPDIIVGTPSRVLAHVVAKNLYLKESLEMLVIDEADLVLSFGYDNDIKSLLRFVV